MPARPKLLFLAWDFPPAQSIGSVRTWNVAKHLARLGWDVTVVTPDPRIMRNVHNPDKTRGAIEAEGIQQILTGHGLRFLSPSRLACWNQAAGWIAGGIGRRIARALGISSAVGWIREAERACERLAPEHVDLIFASGPPFSAFVLAERLAKKLNRPYVLDYRDPWWTELGGMFRIFQPIIDRLEARLVKGSAAITIVSPSWASDLDARFKRGSGIHVITNGYDPEDLAAVKPHSFGHFAIVYAGIFYPPDRVVTPLLAALKRLEMRSTTREWYFHYYGDHDQHVREEAKRLGIERRVKVHGLVPRSEAMSATRGANIAVVIGSVFNEASAGMKGWIPAKMFEIIGLGTPVLLISPPGTDVEKIAEPSGLSRRFTGEDTDAMAEFIEKRMTGPQFKQTSVGSITWNFIAGKLDRVLREQLLPV